MRPRCCQWPAGCACGPHWLRIQQEPQRFGGREVDFHALLLLAGLSIALGQRGIVETAMGRAWLAQQTAAARNAFLARAKRERPDEFARSTEGLKDSLAHYPKRGFSINMGDAGLGVLAVGVASKIRYGPRRLLFNCAVPGYRARPGDLLKTIGPTLVELVRLADRQVGVG